MTDIMHTTFWNYNDFVNYNPQMLRDWVELGITTPIAPRFRWGKDSNEAMLAMLDDAQALGVRLILQVNTVDVYQYSKGADVLRAATEEVHAVFGSHPAFYGYYVGEEPSDVTQEYYMEGAKIIKEVAPNAVLYMNFGSIERTERVMIKGEYSIDSWIEKYKEYTGSDVIGFGIYSGLFRDNSGSFEHFYNIRTFVEAAKKCDVDVWATMLSSAHDYYRVPTEDDYRWQLNTCMACGCKGVVWFRLYDKLVASDYRGSPIDEFGVKTPHFYDMARVQKRFNIHYGKIMADLKHIDAYGVGVSYGGYSYFTNDVPAGIGIIDSADCRSGMLSFFKDKDGNDYVVILNTHTTESYHMTLTYAPEVARADFVYHNGAQLNANFVRKEGQTGPAKGQSVCLAPGMIELIKITKA